MWCTGGRIPWPWQFLRCFFIVSTDTLVYIQRYKLLHTLPYIHFHCYTTIRPKLTDIHESTIYVLKDSKLTERVPHDKQANESDSYKKLCSVQTHSHARAHNTQRYTSHTTIEIEILFQIRWKEGHGTQYNTQCAYDRYTTQRHINDWRPWQYDWTFQRHNSGDIVVIQPANYLFVAFKITQKLKYQIWL